MPLMSCDMFYSNLVPGERGLCVMPLMSCDMFYSNLVPGERDCV